jgi:hypothetical protein
MDPHLHGRVIYVQEVVLWGLTAYGDKGRWIVDEIVPGTSSVECEVEGGCVVADRGDVVAGDSAAPVGAHGIPLLLSGIAGLENDAEVEIVPVSFVPDELRRQGTTSADNLDGCAGRVLRGDGGGGLRVAVVSDLLQFTAYHSICSRSNWGK